VTQDGAPKKNEEEPPSLAPSSGTRATSIPYLTVMGRAVTDTGASLAISGPATRRIALTSDSVPRWLVAVVMCRAADQARTRIFGLRARGQRKGLGGQPGQPRVRALGCGGTVGGFSAAPIAVPVSHLE
jgi:hypothetical protein